VRLPLSSFANLPKCGKYDACAKKNASHAEPNNTVAAVVQKVVQYINSFLLYMFDKCEDISTKLIVAMKAYGEKMQSVVCIMLEYMKRYLEYLISRLSHTNVDETDAALSSQLSETREPEWWHQVSITTERTRLTSEDGSPSLDVSLVRSVFANMPKCRKYNARVKKNATHAKPNNIVAAVVQKVVRYINSFLLYMFDKCEDISTKLIVAMKACGEKIQSVVCYILEYMKRDLEYLISRLSHNNADETDATLSSQLSGTSEPEWWH
ncbi:hypothetical protein M513_09297, partial [Trichuris suis]